jgi:hypothetical protein
MTAAAGEDRVLHLRLAGNEAEKWQEHEHRRPGVAGVTGLKGWGG